MILRAPSRGLRLWLRAALALAAMLAAACDSSRSPNVGASAAGTSSARLGPSAVAPSARASDVGPPEGAGSADAGQHAAADGTGAAATSLPNELPPDLRESWADLVGRELPDRFAGAEERRYYARCLAFTKALHLEAAELGRKGELEGLEEGDPTGPMRAIDAVRAHPPPDATAEDVTFCSEYTLGGLRLELATRRAADARRTLQALAGAMVAAHARTGKLCPSSERPVPEEVGDVLQGPYQPKPADWEGASWRCLRFRWLVPMRFQIQVRATAKSFSLLARGSPAEDGKIDEYRLDGEIGPRGIELGEVQGRYLLTE